MKNKLKNYTSLLILCGIVFTYSCNSVKEQAKKIPTKVEEAITNIPGTATDPERNFFYAWLADCVNDNYEDYPWDKATLLSLANNRITRALKDDTIINAFGNAELVWGPQLVLREDLNGDYSSSNLVYCIKRYLTRGSYEYVVGIAGTNMISSNDWFSEDLSVQTATSSPFKIGLISNGTATGLNQIKSMTSNGKYGSRVIPNVTLKDYLNTVLSNPRDIVSVSGHSLGGALTQAYSAELQTQLTAGNPIQAWVYAGPSAGDKAFADELVTKVGYHAYNNSLDAIPHAWERDKLNKLCSLYEGQYLCNPPIKSNSAVNGVVTYLKGIGGNYSYTTPGSPVSFTGNIGSFGYCSDVNDLVFLIYHNGGENEIYKYLNEIKKHCNPSGDGISEEDIRMFIYYFAMMGEQHTTAYVNKFFTTQEIKEAVARYAKGDSGYYSSTENKLEGRDILEKFLTKAAGFLKSQSGTNCNCN